MTALVYVVLSLAAYRLARAVAVDDISLPLRDRLYTFAWDDDELVETEPGLVAPKARAAWRTWLYALFTCPLCIGFWISAALYSVWRWWGNDVTHAVIAICAVAGLQCFLATRSDA